MTATLSIGEVVCLAVDQGDGTVDVGSVAAERLLLPIIGPTTFVLTRLVLRLVHEDGHDWMWFPVDELARMLGVKPLVVLNSLKRAERFGVAAFDQGQWTFHCSWQPRLAVR